MSLRGPRCGRFSYRVCRARLLSARATDAQIGRTAGTVSVPATPLSQIGRQPEFN